MDLLSSLGLEKLAQASPDRGGKPSLLRLCNGHTRKLAVLTS